jgi:hypothetical protein
MAKYGVQDPPFGTVGDACGHGRITGHSGRAALVRARYDGSFAPVEGFAANSCTNPSTGANPSRYYADKDDAGAD